VLLVAEEETGLRVMSENLTEIGSCFGLEKNLEKNEVMRIRRQQSPA